VAQKRLGGFLGVESVRDAGGEGVSGITVAYWASLEAIAGWRVHGEHQLAQRLGRERWYQDSHVRCKVERECGFSRWSACACRGGDAASPGCCAAIWTVALVARTVGRRLPLRHIAACSSAAPHSGEARSVVMGEDPVKFRASARNVVLARPFRTDPMPRMGLKPRAPSLCANGFARNKSGGLSGLRQQNQAKFWFYCPAAIQPAGFSYYFLT